MVKPLLFNLQLQSKLHHRSFKPKLAKPSLFNLLHRAKHKLLQLSSFKLLLRIKHQFQPHQLSLFKLLHKYKHKLLYRNRNKRPNTIRKLFKMWLLRKLFKLNHRNRKRDRSLRT
jgi:hypothetical protein